MATRCQIASQVSAFLVHRGPALQRQLRAHLGIEGHGDCIPGSRIATAFARSLGLKSEIVPCGMVIMNPFWTRRFVALGADIDRMLTDPRAPRWKAKGGGVATTPVDDVETPGSLSVHLISVIEDEYLIDTTSWQFSSQDPSATWLKPVTLRVQHDFATQRREAAAIRMREGAHRALFYRSRPEFRKHLSSSLSYTTGLIEPHYVQALTRQFDIDQMRAPGAQSIEDNTTLSSESITC